MKHYYTSGYQIEEVDSCLSLKIDKMPEVIMKPAEPIKVIPTILHELSLNEKKRKLDPKKEANRKAKEARRTELFSTSTLKNVALKVAYLGWKYNGLARQINTDDTIEEILLQACERCCLIDTAKNFKITRCGRTDKGVSAFTQVISLNLRSKTGEDETDPEKEYDYVAMINNVLPPKIRVIAWAYVGLEFDARFQVLYRSYKYYFPKCDLDIELMRESLDRFVGTHNFRGFCKADRTLEHPNYKRTISYLSVDLVSEDMNDGNFSIYCISILGHAFLWHQIRNMVSVIFRIGLGLESPKVVSGMLDAGVKYNYDMASEIPLVLFDCEFENIDWNESKVDLSEIWFESSVKTTLIRQLMSKDLLSVKNVRVLCDTKKQSIMSRPFIS